jgi:hypothetical protein
MSIAVVRPPDRVVADLPPAREMRETLMLAREALARIDVQPWGELEGPAIGDLIARIDSVLKVEQTHPRPWRAKA